jgi:hypothetical protein
MCSLALGLVTAVAALWPLIDPLSPSKEEQNTKRIPQFLKDLGEILSWPIAVLWNKIAPQSGGDTDMSEVRYFLEPEDILNAAHLNEAELLHTLSRSIVANVAYSNHIATFRFRRGWIRAQLVFIVSGVLLLIPALIARLFIS